MKFSSICASMTREALKAEIRAKAKNRESTTLKITPWVDGKPQRKYISFHNKNILIIFYFIFSESKILIDMSPN